MITVAFKMDYGWRLPPEEQWVTVRLDSRYGGQSYEVHQLLTELFATHEEVVLVDEAGEQWSFLEGSVAGFVVVGRELSRIENQ